MELPRKLVKKRKKKSCYAQLLNLNIVYFNVKRESIHQDNLYENLFKQ